MTALPAKDYANDNARTEGQIKQVFEDIIAASKELLGGITAGALTISAGAVTPTTGTIVVDTEASAATDDLDSAPQPRATY